MEDSISRITVRGCVKNFAFHGAVAQPPLFCHIMFSKSPSKETVEFDWQSYKQFVGLFIRPLLIRRTFRESFYNKGRWAMGETPISVKVHEPDK